jgi:hypothetical protein
MAKAVIRLREWRAAGHRATARAIADTVAARFLRALRG